MINKLTRIIDWFFRRKQKVPVEPKEDKPNPQDKLIIVDTNEELVKKVEDMEKGEDGRQPDTPRDPV